MKISLNLASRPFTDLTDVYKRLRIAMGVLALAAIALGVLLHFVLQHDQRAYLRAHSIDESLGSLAAERQGYETLMQQPANARVLDETDALNELFDQKAFSWTLVMKDLETVLPDPVQVTEIEPARTKDGQVILHLRVVGPREENIRLVENMEHSNRFLRPRIVGESPESNNGSGARLQTVSANSVEDLDLLTDYNLMQTVSDAPAAGPAKASPAKPLVGGAK
ncbi:fimbrial assembly protein [Acidobacteria bacterium AB60]|nr:fimbrial assembly protein [Acidobacteria bacterium AB60]